MSLKIVLDMNLSPSWVTIFEQHGYSASHWFAIGDPRATDPEIMGWAKTNQHIVFTHDLDFGRLLALTQADGPSVIQVRTQDVSPASLETVILTALKSCGAQLEAGALVVVDENKLRIRILPLNI